MKSIEVEPLYWSCSQWGMFECTFFKSLVVSNASYEVWMANWGDIKKV